MALVTLSDITKTYGPLVVLRDLTLEVQPGEHVGLVGANGAGKTTLFKLIAGQEQPDVGTVTRSRGLRVGYLPQEPQLDSQASLIAEVERGFDKLRQMEDRLHKLAMQISEHHDSAKLESILSQYDRLRVRFEAAGGYAYEMRLQEVLGGLGFHPRDYDLPISVLSGGQKCRAALARLLLEEADLLLLDEPTNHLDIDATRWLEKFLAGYRGAVVLVSHDRYLLDRVTTKTIEAENRGVTVYPCSYSHYAESKRVRLLTGEREYQAQQEFIRHEQEFIRKHIASQRSKEARGRRTRLERMYKQGQVLDKPRARRKKMAMDFARAERGGDMILRCEHTSKRYGDTVLFEDFNLDVQRGEKVGIIGPNGVGKTTLLKMGVGWVKPDNGTVRIYENLSIGYYDQEHADLNLDNTVIEEVQPRRPGASQQQIRSFLGRFLFHGDDVFKPIRQLSGGEQSRVVLAKLICASPQLLVLDEPTNHLDIPSREVLEQALIDFPASILLVSHDRYLLDCVIDRLVVLERGRYEVHPGNYADYVRKQEEQDAASREPVLPPTASGKPNRKRSGAMRSQTRERELPHDDLSLEELEEVIIEKETRLAAIEERFADEELYRDEHSARELRQKYDELQAELAALNAAWHSRSD